MKYLVCYVWNSTRGNHAGMAHMCNLLKEKWSDQYRVIKYYQQPIIRFWPIGRLNLYTCSIITSFLNYRTRSDVRKMLIHLKDGDSIYLLEYIHPLFDFMRPLISRINLVNKNVRILGMAHLTPSFLKIHFGMNSEILLTWSDKVDKLLTLGTSLSNYFISSGTPKDKVITLFHYVDSQYYRPFARKNGHCFQVIIQGNLQRNYDIIERVVSSCPSVHFLLLCGRLTLPQFEKYSNVKVLTYISESALRKEMNDSDVSLNVMDDTVGSNVIVTSMSMGLAMIVSDVGSIRDYCDETNAIFCKTTDDYCNAINKLSTDNALLQNMKNSSLQRSKIFSIERFHRELNEL